MIILVMVIGMQAKDALLHAAPAAADQEPAIDVTSARAAAVAVEADLHQLAAKIKRQEFETGYRRKERDKIQLLLAAAEEALAARRGELDEEAQRQFDRQRELVAANSELEQLEQSIRIAESSIVKTAIIEHLPTPMARTVFGKELHFQLSGGKLTYVPWDEFTEKLRTEAPQQVWRLKETPEVTDTIGPLGGFLMKYQLQRTQLATETRVGVAIQQRVELDHFVLIPVDANMGEPVASALQEGSQLQSVLAAHRPESTTITIWTYPDSFNDFRTLKQDLFQRGYLTAARPMPENMPIGGSPRGSRSAAQ